MNAETPQAHQRTSHDESKATVTVALSCLNERFSTSNPPVGYLSGRTHMRNVIAEETGCSLLRAERLVEQLEALGHIVYEGDTYSRQHLPDSWSLVHHPKRDRRPFRPAQSPPPSRRSSR